MAMIFCLKRFNSAQLTCFNRYMSYYVTLPEIPPDTPETNSLLRLHEHPNYAALSPDLLITGCAKLALEFDVSLGSHIEKLSDHSVPKSFDSVFLPVEKLLQPLNYAWQTSKNLNTVNNQFGYREAFKRVHPQVERAKNERWLSMPLFNAAKEVSADKKRLNHFQTRLVNMYILEARLNGIDFTGLERESFISYLGQLVNNKTHFRNKVLLSHNMYSHTIGDKSLLSDIPDHILHIMAVDKLNPQKGPWKVTLNQALYHPFLEYCPDTNERWSIWMAYNNRASSNFSSQNLYNGDIINNLRSIRKAMSKMLGYDTFSEMSMETKMAGSVDNVMNMIDSLKSRFKPLAEEEITELQRFAGNNSFKFVLEHWDVPYWRRLHREHLYGLNKLRIDEYFSLSSVLDGLFTFCNKVFGIEIKNCSDEVPRVHPSVMFFRVYNKEDGNEMASFYVDPYIRYADKSLRVSMEVIRDRSQLHGTNPISYLNLDLNPPVGNADCTMSLDQVESIFSEFGHGLQQMLTAVPYCEISGQRNIEWDAMYVSSYLMGMLLYTPYVLKLVGTHIHTGASLQDDVINNIIAAKKHMCGWDMVRQLYYSAYDMEIYTVDDDWNKVMNSMWNEFIPLPLEENDFHPCSMTSIFSENYSASYYSFKWSQMLAADVFEQFSNDLQDDSKLEVTGMRFRNTFLSLGGGVSASEVFRKFRGRDPSQDSLFRYFKTQN